ncbi:CWC16 protein [Cokeromyces recurvatus]|uniref:CWC16 protein n=1 Tax=Cokeromyces recurvatus TaxID=90255 RepID=UPI00222052E2|nr:CWC16 protein [Cokeromyces recurvatus]KAI7898113.1 CWC16 protein [Cokeromyces recurvatus]
MQPFNKYYPPDWTPEKGSINKFYGKHALGDRARKLDEGILIVRFELPFNIWCSGCENHIGKGVRYNAQKKQIGKYYSTPILQFRMKCHLCDNWIEIHTDPKNHEYVIVSGARKKVEEWAPEDTEVIQLQDEDVKERLETDPMYRLEHGVKDKSKIEETKPRLTQLQSLNDAQWADPYTRSQQLRRQFREEKKKEKQKAEEAERIRDKHSLQIELLPEQISDVIEAKSIDYHRQNELISSSNPLDTKRLGIAVSPMFTKKKIGDNTNSKNSLGKIVKIHTRLKTDPFYNSKPFSNKLSKEELGNNKTNSNNDDNSNIAVIKKKARVILENKDEDNDKKDTIATLVAAYHSSDSESD